VFILYGLLAGIVLGTALGGRLGGLAAVRFRWGWLVVLGLAIQMLIFTAVGDALVGGAGPALYVLSTAMVLVVVIANVRLPGLALVAGGAVLNLVAIVANGGRMPADPAALASLGIEHLDGPTNSVLTAEPVLRPLTDVFALPVWLPLANVFSVGDVLIGIGLVVAVAAAMRTTRRPDHA
jgi:uncharacterized protein DUF5317